MQVNDIVLIKEPHTKKNNYPLARVLELQTNDLQEVTGATIRKGSTKETIRRHVNSLIFLFRPSETKHGTSDFTSDGSISDRDVDTVLDIPTDQPTNSNRPIRQAAKEGQLRLQELICKGRV